MDCKERVIRLKLFLVSSLLVNIVLFIKSVNIPIGFGPDYEFIGWKNLFTIQNCIAFAMLLLILGAFWAIGGLRIKIRGAADTLPFKCGEIENESFNSLGLFFTIVSLMLIDMDEIRGVVLLAFIYLTYTCIFLKIPAMLINTTYAILGYQLYKSCQEKKLNNITIPKGALLLHYGELKETDSIQLIQISNQLFYCYGRG